MYSNNSKQHNVPNHWRRPDVLLASLTLNLTTLALPLVILQVYDRILPNNALDTFALMISALLFAAVIELFLRIARSTILAWKGAQFEQILDLGEVVIGLAICAIAIGIAVYCCKKK